MAGFAVDGLDAGLMDGNRLDGPMTLLTGDVHRIGFQPRAVYTSVSMHFPAGRAVNTSEAHLTMDVGVAESNFGGLTTMAP